MDIYRAIERTKIQFDFIVHGVHGEKNGHFAQEIRALGGRIYSVPKYRFYNISAYRKAWSDFLDAHPRYDSVHIHTTNSAAAILSVLANHGVRQRIVHAHSASNPGMIKHILLRLSRRTINRLATLKLAVSNKAAVYVYGKTATDAGQISVVPDAIDAEKYVFHSSARAAMRKALSITDSLVIGHIGRFSKVKNHDFLIDIFSCVVKSHPDTKLVLVGDGPLRGKIADKAKRLGLSENVIFTGQREDVPALLQAFDVLAFPSHYEGLPGVVTEAQAAGLPCLLSDRITRESAIIPELCTFLSIDSGTEPWLNALAACNNTERRNTFNEIAKAGFDSHAQAHAASLIYIPPSRT
jgi:glycosyltransferase involved in cell wall biosynthesis